MAKILKREAAPVGAAAEAPAAGAAGGMEVTAVGGGTVLGAPGAPITPLEVLEIPIHN
jgi:hypothetical protein